jgi:glutamate synthase domain-containing protein 3
MQQVAAIFPLKWMTQGARSVFLPDSFASREVAGNWETGRTFAAGMSGGIAYVWDREGTFPSRVNKEMVELEPLDAGDLEYVRSRIEKHVALTESARGREILDRWPTEQSRFVKVMPTDYKRALAELRKLAEQEQQEARQQEVKVHG